MLWTVPLLPLAGVAAIVVLRRRRSGLGWLAVAATLATLAASLLAASAGASAGWRWGGGLALTLAAVDLGRIMAVLVPAVAAPVILYAWATHRTDPGLVRLLALLLAFVAAMELLVLADDLLTLLIGWELVGAISWALIAHGWRERENATAAAEAFLTTRLGDLGLYLAAAAAFAGTGSLGFRALEAAGGPALHVVAAGVLLAAAAKSAQLPFSAWLFAAMAGPAPVSALLHSATMVAAGAYLLARLLPVLEPTGWFAPAVLGLGLATALAGGVVAVLQGEIKKVLAASTSSQYGLVLVAVGAGVPAAAMLHLVNHAVFKALLFLGAGTAVHAAGTATLARMRLGRRLPAVAALFGVGAFALAAVPPLGGAYSKEAVLAAAALAGGWAAAGVLVAGTLSALYAARLQLLAFGPGTRSEAARPGGAALAALGALAAAALLLGVAWLPGGPALAEKVLGGTLAHGAAWELAAALGSVAAGVAVAVLFWHRGTLATLALPAQAHGAAADWLGLPAVTQVLVAAPTARLAAALARFDDRVVDAGVRLAAGVGRALSRLLSWWGERGVDGLVEAVAYRIARPASRLLSWWGERGIDGLVEAVAGATLAAATGSRAADERTVDRAVEDVALGVGFGGAQSRRLQTGLAHHYYILVAVGLVLLVAVAGLWR